MNTRTASEALRRADWLRVLALADARELRDLATPVVVEYRFEALRLPEVGLVMARARIGNRGDRYNLGEVTVTRCALRHRAPDGQACIGVGHVLGRDADRAQCVAQLDALLQRADLLAPLMSAVVIPLRDRQADRARQAREHTEASRVRFFALQPEAS